MRAGRLDAVEVPVAPLDILAQQIIAETAAQEWKVDDLYALVTTAHPYRSLTRAAFDEVLDLVSDGIETGRGTRAAYVHHDRVNGELRGRKGARLAALTSGGAIPELGDFRVVAEPDETLIGSVNEDWATESMAGDVFILGTHHWQIRQVTGGEVRVVDAGDKHPTIPFWRGEAPARTVELSEEVARIRSVVERGVVDDDLARSVDEIVELAGVERDAAATIVTYLAAARAVLGVMPTQDDLVIERFFDESGGMQLVVHSPYGGRLNRAMGYALRKKFCAGFNFELQASANDDAVVISLGPHHSFPLADVPRFLTSGSIRATLQQAILDQPIFQSRWRWNLNRSLVVLRFRGGRKVPPPFQRMQSDDLLAAVFPGAAACQENVTGPDRGARPPRSRARRCTTASPRRSTATGSSSCGGGSRTARCASTSSTPPSRPCSPTRSSTPRPTRSSTTVRPSTGARAPSRSGGASRWRSRRWGGSPRRRSTGSGRRSSRRPPRPTSSTTS